MQTMQQQCRPALGTLVEIAIHEEDLPGSACARESLFASAFAAIAAVEQEMSFHAPQSSLSRLNRTPAGVSLKLPAWTYEVLETAMMLHAATDGQFDCGIAHRLVRSGLLPDHGLRALAQSSLEGLQLEGAHTVTVLRPTCVDLGGIAKGFAVDKAVDALHAAGVSRCRINAGGDIRISGREATDIFIRHPTAPGLAVLLGQLAEGAVATSAPYYSLCEHAGEATCALLDPQGKSLTAPVSYTVLAPTCMIADALTKAVAVCASRAPQRSSPLEAAPPQPFHAGFLAQFQAQAFILHPPLAQQR